MKTKYIIVLQVALLALTLVAGLLLKDNLSDGPRVIHRGVGALAGLTGLVGAVLVTIRRSSVTAVVVGVSWASVLLSFMAAFAGRSLKTATDYDQMFAVMRFSGILALVCAGYVLYKCSKLVAKKELSE
jgi:hypothetical protein